jgi:hypothetical protein
MSGLYNMVFGMNPLADVILATLGLKRSDVGRFRDCYVAEGQIAVYTRNGGGNREEYQDVIDALAQHPCYVRDADDEFDSTYATIYFRFPEEYAEGLSKIDIGEKWDPDARWQALLSALEPASPGPNNAEKEGGKP